MEQEFPLVSVIITTYNRAHLVFKCLEGVLFQNYPNLEVIVVDDCSSDNTEDLFREYSHPKVKYIRHEKNMKVSAATNTGFKNSNGRYITAIGDDDVWNDPEKLKKQIEIFQNPGYNLVNIKIKNTLIKINKIYLADLHGKLIPVSNIIKIDDNHLTIDTDQLTPGMYFIIFISDKKIFTEKLIVY